jgi:hypothetical protein
LVNKRQQKRKPTWLQSIYRDDFAIAEYKKKYGVKKGKWFCY